MAEEQKRLLVDEERIDDLEENLSDITDVLPKLTVNLNQITQKDTRFEDQKITQIEESVYQNTQGNRRNLSRLESAFVDQSLETERLQRDKLGLIQEDLFKHGRHLDKHGRRIDDHIRRIADHRREIGDHCRKINNYRQGVHHKILVYHHRRQIDHHKSQIDDHDKQIYDRTRQTDDHDRKIDDHGNDIDDHGRRIDEQSRQIQTQETKFKPEVADIKHHLPAHNAPLKSEHGRKIDDHYRQRDDHERQIDHHYRQIDHHYRQIDDHYRQIDDHYRQIHDHYRQRDDHERQIHDHERQRDDHYRQIHDHYRQRDDRERQRDDHERQIHDHERQIHDHERQRDDHEIQIDHHERQIDHHKRQIDHHYTQIDHHYTQIQTQETKLKQEVAEIKLHMPTYKAPLKSGNTARSLGQDFYSYHGYTLKVPRKGFDNEMERTCSPYAKKLLQDAKKEYEGTQMILCRDSKDNAVIIGYDTTVSLSKIKIPDKYKGRLRIKHPKNVSDEASMASKYVLENKRNLSAEEQNIIQRCINQHSSNLWKAHSNLTMISGDCVKYTGGIPKDTVCIVLYCLSKGFIPFEEDTFPTLLQENRNSIEVDVREGYFQFGPNNLIGLTNSWNDPVCMGSSIANENVGKTGSVGPFVSLPNDEIGFLTCCHVLFDCIHLPSLNLSYEEPQRGQICKYPPPFVMQPSSSSAVCGRDIKEKRCGYVRKAIFKPDTDPVSVDAALVKITNGIPNTGHFAISEYTEITETGYTKESPPMYTGGKIIRNIQSQDREKPVIKSGNKTGLTKGELRLNGLEVSISEDGAFLGDSLIYHPKRVMKGQYEVRSSMTFFDLGDSGSGVFLKDPDGSLKCIGIAIGRTSFYGTVVTPIGAVLHELELEEKDMTNFGQPMD